MSKSLAALAEKAACGPRRRTRRLLWTGLAFLMVQWGMLARLTFWELSWDVIEPITYFLGSGTTILFYCYFMVRPDQEQAAACAALLALSPKLEQSQVLDCRSVLELWLHCAHGI